jgi:trans-L-3-hydroxyproline dehydratase
MSQMPLDPATRIETVEMHTGGEAVRIVTSGYPSIPGATLLDKRRHARDRLDLYRRLIMWEPRGHYDMYGVLPVEPDHPQADMAVLFIHNEGYSTMCGHATMALGRYALDQGIIRAEAGVARLNLQCPCGLVRVTVSVDGQGKAGDVSFLSVPAFAFALDLEIEVPGIGRVPVDIGYGGAFYAFLPARAFGLDVRGSPIRDLVAAAHAVTQAVKAGVTLEHPDSLELAFLYGTILTDGETGADPQRPSANVCVFAEREVDRSPTGSGVTARLALLAARGGIADGQTCRFRSVTGTEFEGRVVERLRAGRFAAIRAEVSGRSHYTGRSVFTLEGDDPLAPGFLLS